jgi:hypothetical protein
MRISRETREEGRKRNDETRNASVSVNSHVNDSHLLGNHCGSGFECCDVITLVTVDGSGAN